MRATTGILGGGNLRTCSAKERARLYFDIKLFLIDFRRAITEKEMKEIELTLFETEKVLNIFERYLAETLLR